MPSERAARDDFLTAAEHIGSLMSITDGGVAPVESFQDGNNHRFGSGVDHLEGDIIGVSFLV